MPSLGPAEILVVILVALLVFGPHRLPEVARQVGKGVRELRKLQETVRSELDGVLHGDDEPEPPTAEAAPETASPPPSSAVSIPPTRPAPRAPSRFRPPTPGPTV